MPPTPLIILGILLLAAALLLLESVRGVAKRGAQAVVGICYAAMDQTVRKNTNKEKALAFVRERGEASNEEIREHLGVSRQSVVRYMNELEKEGSVRQIGATGRGVVYRFTALKQ